MKIERLSEDNFIVFLNNLYINNHKLQLNANFEECFKLLFKTLSNSYNIDISGYYDIKIYCDKLYGYILNIKREDLDFYDYYDEQIDMKISINEDQKFLFKLKDTSVLNKIILEYCYLFKDEKHVYILPKKTINQQLLGNIIENSEIIYGCAAQNILMRCKDIKTKQVFV